MKEKVRAANARFAQKTASLLSEMGSFDHEQLNRKPADGGWSAMQVMYHLVLVEENSLAYVRKKLSFNPALKKAGLSERARNVLLWVTLYSPFKFKAPPSAGSEHIPDTGSLAEVRSRWEKVRSEWADFFENMPDTLTDKAVYRHPVAGRLGWYQMVQFLSAHFERHRRQINQVLAKVPRA